MMSPGRATACAMDRDRGLCVDKDLVIGHDARGPEGGDDAGEDDFDIYMSFM